MNELNEQQQEEEQEEEGIVVAVHTYKGKQNWINDRLGVAFVPLSLLVDVMDVSFCFDGKLNYDVVEKWTTRMYY